MRKLSYVAFELRPRYSYTIWYNTTHQTHAQTDPVKYEKFNQKSYIVKKVTKKIKYMRDDKALKYFIKMYNSSITK